MKIFFHEKSYTLEACSSDKQIYVKRKYSSKRSLFYAFFKKKIIMKNDEKEFFKFKYMSFIKRIE